MNAIVSNSNQEFEKIVILIWMDLEFILKVSL